MSGHFSIGRLASETGVKVVTIRYYEQIGVLSVPAADSAEGERRSEGKPNGIPG